MSSHDDRDRSQGSGLVMHEVEVTTELAHTRVRPGCVVALLDGIALVIIVEIERRNGPRRAPPLPLPESIERREERPDRRSTPPDAPELVLRVAPLDKSDIRRAIEEHVLRSHGVTPAQIVLIRARSLPRDATGTIDRGAVSRAWRDGTLLTIKTGIPPPPTGR